MGMIMHAREIGQKSASSLAKCLLLYLPPKDKIVVDVCGLKWVSKNLVLQCFHLSFKKIFLGLFKTRLFICSIDHLIPQFLSMVSFGLLRDLAQKELSEYLDKYAGTKVKS
jgi:hypothetical protein